MIGPVERTRQAAAVYALTQVGHGVYKLGTGDWNTFGAGDARDCAGFAICECFGLKRHRPGYNTGPWASVSDDINCNSVIEDALHKQELFRPVGPSETPEPGDLLTYPTIHVKGMDGQMKTFIGHVGILHDVYGWDPANPKWGSLRIIQCCGPDGRAPGIVETWATHWDGHDVVWPKKTQRSILLRRKDPVEHDAAS